MAKRKAARRARTTARAAGAARSARATGRAGKRKAEGSRKARSRRVAKKAPGRRKKKATAKRVTVRAPRKTAVVAQRARRRVGAPGEGKRPRLDRVRRTLDDTIVPTPPSSLDLDRRGSAARSGRAELAESLRRHSGMTPDITGGDLDVDVESAYFNGEEAPGGDNPTPDQEVVDDIGKALGLEYADNEELKSGDKLNERDRHRWELDPASSEDYKDRK